jgi:hypothetical protein
LTSKPSPIARLIKGEKCKRQGAVLELSKKGKKKPQTVEVRQDDVLKVKSQVHPSAINSVKGLGIGEGEEN